VSNENVTDDIINEGFRSLAQVMSEGFDAARREREALRSEMNRRFAELEHRMMRRFDDIGGRVDDHERRITTLEAKR